MICFCVSLSDCRDGSVTGCLGECVPLHQIQFTIHEKSCSDKSSSSKKTNKDREEIKPEMLLLVCQHTHHLQFSCWYQFLFTCRLPWPLDFHTCRFFLINTYLLSLQLSLQLRVNKPLQTAVREKKNNTLFWLTLKSTDWMSDTSARGTKTNTLSDFIFLSTQFVCLWFELTFAVWVFVSKCFLSLFC